MGFDKEAFMQAQFSFRTFDVKVPELKDFFGKGEKAIWKVRNLTGNEIGIAVAYASKQDVTEGIVEGVLSGKSKEVKDAIKELIGNTDNVPVELAKRIAYLKIGSIDPECSEELALRINKEFPFVLMKLTNKILTLSGQGSLPGKSKASGKAPKSRQA